MKVEDDIQTYALVSLFSPPDQRLLELSHGALLTCRYLGNDSLRVIPVYCILAVVGMIPHSHTHMTGVRNLDRDLFFVVEKIGLEGTSLQDTTDVDLSDEE